MAKSSVADIERDALVVINDVRARFGGEPIRALPQGLVGSPEDCPIQRALRDLGLGDVTVYADRVSGVKMRHVAALSLALRRHGRAPALDQRKPGDVSLPRRLRLFVQAFDHEELLHLRLEDIKPEDAVIKEPAAAQPCPFSELIS